MPIIVIHKDCIFKKSGTSAEGKVNDLDLSRGEITYVHSNKYLWNSVCSF